MPPQSVIKRVPPIQIYTIQAIDERAVLIVNELSMKKQ